MAPSASIFPSFQQPKTFIYQKRASPIKFVLSGIKTHSRRIYFCRSNGNVTRPNLSILLSSCVAEILTKMRDVRRKKNERRLRSRKNNTFFKRKGYFKNKTNFLTNIDLPSNKQTIEGKVVSSTEEEKFQSGIRRITKENITRVTFEK